MGKLVKNENFDRAKENIIEAAISIFASKSILASSMRDIAKKISIETPLLYYYFQNKDDLIKSVISSISLDIQQQGIEMKAKLDANGTFTTASKKGRFFEVVRHIYDYSINNPEKIKVFRQIAYLPHELRDSTIDVMSCDCPLTKLVFSTADSDSSIKILGNDIILLIYLPIMDFALQNSELKPEEYKQKEDVFFNYLWKMIA